MYKTHWDILDHGHVTLLDYSGDDLTVANAARVSFNKSHSSFQGEGKENDALLIKYLLVNKHGTPFEHVFFRFRVKAPIFVFREWHRHRVGHSYNEMSARYTELPEEYYIPDTVLEQLGKPGAYTYRQMDEDKTRIFQAALVQQSRLAFSMYREAMSQGVSKQQARLFLPVNTYSEMYWSCNARSLMAFLELRNHPAAQHEIQQYAKAIEAIFQGIMPYTAQNFIDNARIAP